MIILLVSDKTWRPLRDVSIARNLDTNFLKHPVASERGITRWCRREEKSRCTSLYLHRREKNPWLDLCVICISLARALATHAWITREIDTIFYLCVHQSVCVSRFADENPLESNWIEKDALRFEEDRMGRGMSYVDFVTCL